MPTLTKLWDRFIHYLLHRTVFRGRSGEIDFYGLQEEDAPPADGTVIVLDGRFKQQRAYAFRFENRYMMYLPIGRRVIAVFQALHSIDQMRPLAVVEKGQVYTPYGHYDRVPKTYLQLLMPENHRVIPSV